MTYIFSSYYTSVCFCGKKPYRYVINGRGVNSCVLLFYVAMGIVRLAAGTTACPRFYHAHLSVFPSRSTAYFSLTPLWRQHKFNVLGEEFGVCRQYY